MLDTATVMDNNHPNDPTPPEPAKNGSADSVEALEEALASARLRLQERLAGEIEAQRHELDRLKTESEQRRTETNAMVAQANETAARVLREANEAAEKLHHEATEAADHLRDEAKAAAERVEREAAQAAERSVREAKESATSVLSQAQEAAQMMLNRVREQADNFFAFAATEVETVEQMLASMEPESDGQRSAAPRENGQSRPADKDRPSRWIRSALKGRPTASSASTPEPESAPTPATATEPATATPTTEAMVTRVIVRPLVGANTRTRIKERFEAIPGIQAVKLGPSGDESFELLVIHPREAKVRDSVLAVAPDEIELKEQKVGYLEIQLKDLGWVEQPTEAAVSAP
jgi:hypothetical protein